MYVVCETFEFYISAWILFILIENLCVFPLYLRTTKEIWQRLKIWQHPPNLFFTYYPFSWCYTYFFELQSRPKVGIQYIVQYLITVYLLLTHPVVKHKYKYIKSKLCSFCASNEGVWGTWGVASLVLYPYSRVKISYRFTTGVRNLCILWRGG